MIIIQHSNNLNCVRNIIYRLNSNQIDARNNSNTIAIEYPNNTNSVDLSMVYDIIYAKYYFDFPIERCSGESKKLEEEIKK